MSRGFDQVLAGAARCVVCRGSRGMKHIGLRELRVAHYIDMPGRECNTARDSMRTLVAGLAVAPRARNPVGEQNGEQASSHFRLCRAMSSD